MAEHLLCARPHAGAGVASVNQDVSPRSAFLHLSVPPARWPRNQPSGVICMCPAVDLGIANGGSHDPLQSLCGWNVPEFAHRSACLQMPAAWACCPLGQHVSGKRPEWNQCSPPDDKHTWNSAIRRAPGNPSVFCAHCWGQASCFCALTSLHGELVTPAMLRNWPN